MTTIFVTGFVLGATSVTAIALALTIRSPWCYVEWASAFCLTLAAVLLAVQILVRQPQR